MSVGKVSFGSVIAVYGNNKKVNKINRKLIETAKNNEFMRKDVTNQYINSASSGLLAQAAQKGDRIEIYIIGKEDVNKVKNGEPLWDTIDGILSHVSKPPYNANKMSISDIFMNIFNS